MKNEKEAKGNTVRKTVLKYLIGAFSALLLSVVYQAVKKTLHDDDSTYVLCNTLTYAGIFSFVAGVFSTLLLGGFFVRSAYEKQKNEAKKGERGKEIKAPSRVKPFFFLFVVGIAYLLPAMIIFVKVYC